MECLRGLCGSRRRTRNNQISKLLEDLQKNVFLENVNLKRKLREYNTDSYHEARKINPDFFESRGYTYDKWISLTKEEKMNVVIRAIKALQHGKRQRGRAGSIPREDRNEINRTRSLFSRRLEEGGRRRTRKRRN